MIKVIEKEESQSSQPDGGALDVCVRTKFNSGLLQFDFHFKTVSVHPSALSDASDLYGGGRLQDLNCSLQLLSLFFFFF